MSTAWAAGYLLVGELFPTVVRSVNIHYLSLDPDDFIFDVTVGLSPLTFWIDVAIDYWERIIVIWY